MYAIEFEATIENGIVRIPDNINNVGKAYKAKFIMMYDDSYKMNIENRGKKTMSAISIDTKGYKFDREEAHER